MKLQALFLTAMMTFCMMATKAQVQADSVKKYQKIEQLFKELNMEEECIKAAKTSADQTLANTPQFADKKEDARAFFIKYMGYAAVKEELIRIYSKYYTTEEIDDLIKFYKTSAGKKLSMVAGNIATETLTAYSTNLQAHAEELNQLVNAPAK